MVFRSFIIFTLSLVFISTAEAISPRIVNGTVAASGEFPYMVSYRYRNLHNCGGSIIKRSWILTAAHCIHEEFNNVSNILFGTIDVEDGKNPVENIRTIARAIRNPNFEVFGGYRNDIGLVELTTALEYSTFVRPIRLPPPWFPTPAGELATLVGWGYPKDNAEVLSQLNKVNIFVFPNKICKSVHKENFTERVHICAGVGEGGKGQCSGDSGGPLSIKRMQIGIVSWSVKPCASKGFPGVFTRVSNYIGWIYSIVSLC